MDGLGTLAWDQRALISKTIKQKLAVMFSAMPGNLKRDLSLRKWRRMKQTRFLYLITPEDQHCQTVLFHKGIFYTSLEISGIKTGEMSLHIAQSSKILQKGAQPPKYSNDFTETRSSQHQRLFTSKEKKKFVCKGKSRAMKNLK